MGTVNEKSIETFLTKLKDNSNFAQKIFETNDPSDVQIIAKEAGVNLTMDDIMASKDIFLQAVDKVNEQELSDEDLENVAGGIVGEIIVGGLLVGATALIIAGVAAGSGALVWSMKKWNW